MAAKPGYHHGDLPNALRHAAVGLLAERGVAGFSLREVSRRAGVSHTAATHHFGDVTGLLTAVAVEGLGLLVAEASAAAAEEEDPVRALAAVGQAYVRVGVRHPGHCAVMFRIDVIDPESAAWQDASGRAYDVLHGAVARIAATRRPDLDVPLAAAMAWATVQGLLELEPVITTKAVPEGAPPMAMDALAARVATMLAEGIAAG